MTAEEYTNVRVTRDTQADLWRLKHSLRVPTYDAAIRYLLERAAQGEAGTGT